MGLATIDSHSLKEHTEIHKIPKFGVNLTVPLSTREYKWVLVNCWGNITNCGGVTRDGLISPSRGE